MTARIPDLNGYYEVARNPISRVGVFPYTKKSVEFPGWQSDPDGIVQVYRPQEELGDPETVKSFRLLPWVDDHAMLGNPDVDPSLTAPEKKGVHGTTGEQIEYDPTDRTLYANIKVFSQSLQDAIDAGKKELSMGFRCLYEFASGVFEGKAYDAIQRTIRGNHQASVPHGRMGPGVAVLDHLTFAFDASELRGISDMAKTTRRHNVAKRMGIAVDAVDAALGVDPTTNAKYKAVMDAEEESDGEEAPKGGMTLEDIGAMLKEVGPAMAEINSALAAMAPAGGTVEDPEDPDMGLDDDMEPMMDAAGQPMMDAAGKPMMKKKAVPAAPVADAGGLAACDAAIAGLAVQSGAMHRAVKAIPGAAVPPALAALDAAIAVAKGHRAKIAARRARRRPGTGQDAALLARLKTAEDSLASITSGGIIKSAMAEIAGRDKLANRVSAFVGTFDHAEMTTVDVAKYAADKFGLKPAAGQEITAVESYLHGRQPAPVAPASFGLDSAVSPTSKVAAFVAGVPATKAA